MHHQLALKRIDVYGDEKLIAQIKRHEGERLTAYRDHLGYLTIGVGRCIDKRRTGCGISRYESTLLLSNDIERVSRAISNAMSWTESLSDARRAVLRNMAFQVGVDGLMKFKRTLNLIKSGHFEQAAVEMLDSKWARQTPQRAHELSVQMRDDVWQ